MQQSVNFLKVLPKKNIRLSPLMMCWVILGMIVFLTIISLITGIYQLKVDRTLVTTQSLLENVQQAYDKLARTYPLLASDVPLVNQVSSLAEQVNEKKNELESLEHLIVRRGFSEYMLGLAQVAPETLWLNQIEINNGTSSIILRGYTLNPDTVSQLMSQLSTTTAFKKATFDVFFVKTIKNQSYLKFAIATRDLGPEEENEINQQESTTDKPKE